jgi:tetratricopeptide (TPR) repeat protein
MVWACVGAEAACQSRSASDRAALWADRLESFDWQGTDADFAPLLADATAAVAADPGNVKARYLLAAYRWHSASRNVASAAPATNPTTEPATAPGPAVINIQPVLGDLAQTRAACPTFGPAYAVQGQIERLILNLPIGSDHVRTAVALAPADPQVCFAAGQLDAAEDKWDESLLYFRRCLALDGTFLPQIAELYLHEVGRPDLAVAVVQDDPRRLFDVYYKLRDEVAAGSSPAASAAMDSVRQMLQVVADRPTAPGWVLVSLAGLLQEEKKYTPAILCYQKAIQKEYGQADWHLALASALAECGHNEEAIHEAEICLHLRPQMQAARQLIQEANARPAASSHDKAWSRP